jgi:hypothetical protein
MSLNRLPRAVEKIKIVVISDFKKEAFGDINLYPNVYIEQISKNVLTGINEYIYRVKILALKYFFSKYNTDVLFIDSDTFFISDIFHIFDQIDSGRCVMNYQCLSIDYMLNIAKQMDKEKINSQDRNYLDMLYDIKANGIYSNVNKINKYYLPDDFSHYGSGLIGMQYSKRDTLNVALDICDSMFTRYNYLCAEEFGVSLAFALNDIEIVVENSCLYHYYLEKDVRLLIAYLLGYFHCNDEFEFESYISKHSINKQQLAIVDLPYLPYYLGYLRMKHIKAKNGTEVQNMPTLKFYEVVREMFRGDPIAAKEMFKRLSHLDV